MTTPVSFELAKLLKEKEFNLKVKQRWGIVENIDGDKTPFCQHDCGLFNWNNEKNQLGRPNRSKGLSCYPGIYSRSIPERIALQ